MKVTIDIDDRQAPFILELLADLNYSAVIQDENYEIPEWHKKIVLDRIKTSKPENYIPAKEVFAKLKTKLK